MAKGQFHINSNGVPDDCDATTNESCPFGNHFLCKEDAEKASSRIMKNSFGAFSSIGKGEKSARRYGNPNGSTRLNKVNVQKSTGLLDHELSKSSFSATDRISNYITMNNDALQDEIDTKEGLEQVEREIALAKDEVDRQKKALEQRAEVMDKRVYDILSGGISSRQKDIYRLINIANESALKQ